MVDAFLQLFSLHGVGVLYVLEHLGREAWQTAEVELFAIGESVTNLKHAIVGQANDIAWPGLVDGALTLRHKLCGRREAHGLALTYMQIGFVAFKLSAAHLTEGDTRAVVGVDIGCDLEDETSELWFFGFHHTFLSLCGSWTWSYLDEAVKKFLYAEVVECRTKEHRCHFSFAICLYVKRGIDAIDEFEVVAQFGCIGIAHMRLQLVAVDIHLNLLCDTLFVGCEEVEFVFIDVIHALELCPLIDRPAERSHLDFQFLFEFVEEVEGVSSLTVHLVDEDDDGSLSHSADSHQLTRLRLHTFGSIDHDDSRVNGGERSEGVLGKVLVSGCVEYVYLIVVIIKLHDRCRNRDTTLLLDVHPV